MYKVEFVAYDGGTVASASVEGATLSKAIGHLIEVLYTFQGLAERNVAAELEAQIAESRKAAEDYAAEQA